jgi:nucleotide-binding universal stress UspA family protein
MEVRTMQINKVLVPVDFSSCSDAAVDYAAFVSSTFHASIDVMHVWSPPEELARLADGSSITDPVGRQQVLAEIVKTHAGEQLEAVLQRLDEAGVENARGRLERGTPHRAIAEVADADGYDLIVMGTHGRTGLSHALVGSVTERVVRSSTVPVLSVHWSEQEVGSEVDIVWEEQP